MSDRVVLIGSYPPPYGGCSVHIERLRTALAADFRISVFDFYGRPDPRDDAGVRRFGPVGPLGAFRAFSAIRRMRPAIAHVHVSALDGFLLAAYPLLAALPRDTSPVITIHSGSFVAKFSRPGSWRRRVLTDVLRRFVRIVVVSEEQRTFLESIGIDARKIAVIPAFLAPVAVESARTRATLAAFEPETRLVISSGYGLPHYGFHVLLAAVARARAKDERIGVILCTYNTCDEAYLASLAAFAADGVTTTIVRDLAPSEFGWLLAHADTYVRATDRDGDAVALREAAYFGKTTIASDCVARPSDVCQLFRTGDVVSLAAALERTRGVDVPAADSPGGGELGALRGVYAAAST